MDLYTFIAEIVKALAWPVSLIIFSFMFRSQFASLLGLLKRGKIGLAEFEFEQEVKAIEESNIELPYSPAPYDLIRYVDKEPRGAIIESWLKIEDALIDVAMRKGLTHATARRYAAGPIKAVKDAGILEDSHLTLIENLNELRNRAVHDPYFSPDIESVISYVRLANDLCLKLSQI